MKSNQRRGAGCINTDTRALEIEESRDIVRQDDCIDPNAVIKWDLFCLFDSQHFAVVFDESIDVA
jgi:hypothetical protein